MTDERNPQEQEQDQDKDQDVEAHRLAARNEEAGSEDEAGLRRLNEDEDDVEAHRFNKPSEDPQKRY